MMRTPSLTIDSLKALEQKILWLACWTIHNANHLRDKSDGLKVGGHQASCASMTSIMTALYFSALRPQDRVAVKPHASPVFHGIQFLAGNQTQEKLEQFRGFGGAQSYPSRTKDIDDVDFSTGSVGLGVAITAFASLIQDYIRGKSWGKSIDEGRMIALVGDAELDEGNIYECLQEGWKHGLKNVWWIIDYNRQSLDGVVREGLNERLEKVFEAFGWKVVRLKHGARLTAIFEKPGGRKLEKWIDECPNDAYSALTYGGGGAWRRRLLDDIGDQGEVTALLDSMDDNELHSLMTDLGGHCLETLTEAFDQAAMSDQPTVFIAYTVKGWGTPLAGHKDNHAGLMTRAQMEGFAAQMKIEPGSEWDRTAGTSLSEAELDTIIADTPFFAAGRRRYHDDVCSSSGPQFLKDDVSSTQAGFGKILDAIAKSNTPLAERIVTTSPDVTVSTNLGAWVNRRGLFANENRADHFKEQRIPSTQKWTFSPEGQHLELGIAEMNLFIGLAAAGLSASLFGKRLLPIGTLYDPFISRGLDALNYACYQDARFLLVATPSGITLAPEGGAHQSIATPLIGISQPGLVSFEPAYVDELAVILDWAFNYMQAPEGKGGSVYLRLTTRSIEQLTRAPQDIPVNDITRGAYWLREPGSNAEIVIVYQGSVAPEAIEAAGRIGEARRDVGVLAMTSADRLYAEWSEGQKSPGTATQTQSHIEHLLSRLSQQCTLITVIDGHPGSLAWLGGVRGHKTISLGVEAFGQTGTLDDLYDHYGLSVDAIVSAASKTPGRPIRNLRMVI